MQRATQRETDAPEMISEADVANSRMVVTLRGRVVMTEWAALMRGMAGAAGAIGGYDHLVEASEFDGEWSATEVPRIAEDLAGAVRRVPGRIALVARPPARFEMWRSFLAMIGPAGSRLRIFRSREEALEWLGQAPSGD